MLKIPGPDLSWLWKFVGQIVMAAIYRIGPWFRRGRCLSPYLPSFRLSGAFSLGVVAILTLWRIFDPFYRWTIYAVHVQGLFDNELALHWRILFLQACVIATVASAAVTGLQFIRRITTRRLIALTILISVWLTWWMSYDDFDHWTVRRHALAASPRFIEVGEMLIKEWPTANGALPHLGEFRVANSLHGHALALAPKSLDFFDLAGPFHEDFGLVVWKSKEGVVRFDLRAAVEFQIEFHPPGDEPCSHFDWSGRSRQYFLEATALNRPGWYLVKYDVTRI